MEQAAVRLDGITQVYVTEKAASLAVDRISLQIRQGEFVSLVGPSGCGKTTLLSIIAGLLKPTRGTVELNGNPVTGPSPRVGYMLQQDYLFPWRTILQNALIGLELNGQLTDKTTIYILHLLDEMGLLSTKDRYPAELSGGMRQRVALVRTMAVQPEVMLLDEPFSALDYQTKLQMEELVAHTLSSHGKTALLVTHDITEAIAMSDRILIMDRNPGRISREMVVPDSIRRASPLKAREEPGFHELFHAIWQELEPSERKKG
ncbi:ABC transporter ATP-binding protein [Paenibacillus aurantius]|uniref:ABC transporter ATP-binding protein n=1 Tax=Paenibacillus aurantius TaxID=2918900 RepID=A0AA96LCD7_9BACL|nr:ABC transporter ATP-binding protein [Paenibacillus aurantius]WNQ09182.1 ABC transporter ATP-binding protein [Paenibacillus aurantius]